MCKTDVHRYCEKFSNIFPFPVEEQNCHFEPKKICELQQKTRPKKAKKYSYTKDCKEQPREICDQCEKRSTKPVCDIQKRFQCNYVPEESCKDEAKLYWGKNYLAEGAAVDVLNADMRTPDTMFQGEMCMVMCRGGGTSITMGKTVARVEDWQEEAGELLVVEGVSEEMEEFEPCFGLLARICGFLEVEGNYTGVQIQMCLFCSSGDIELNPGPAGR